VRVEQKSHDENIRKLRDLIKDIKVAMLTTLEPDGSLHARPMMTQDTEFDGTLWFFTGLSSAKIDEIQQDRHVNVSYAEPAKQTYVSVSGTARVSRDQAKMKELWTPLHKAWFPKGLDDPDIALLRVDVEKAEYWDAPSSKLVQLIGFVKAVATGKRYGEEAADHEKVTL